MFLSLYEPTNEILVLVSRKAQKLKFYTNFLKLLSFIEIDSCISEVEF